MTSFTEYIAELLEQNRCSNSHRCRTCSSPCHTNMRNRYHNEWFVSLPIADRAKILGVSYPENTEQMTAITNAWLDMKRDRREQLIEQSGIYHKEGNRFTALGHDF